MLSSTSLGEGLYRPIACCRLALLLCLYIINIVLIHINFIFLTFPRHACGRGRHPLGFVDPWDFLGGDLDLAKGTEVLHDLGGYLVPQGGVLTEHTAVGLLLV